MGTSPQYLTKDIREMTTVFDWFVEHISIVNGIIQTLNIGKGLEQCLTAAEEQNRRLYRLTNLSTTRFSAYFERSLSSSFTLNQDGGHAKSFSVFVLYILH